MLTAAAYPQHTRVQRLRQRNHRPNREDVLSLQGALLTLPSVGSIMSSKVTRQTKVHCVLPCATLRFGMKKALDETDSCQHPSHSHRV